MQGDCSFRIVYSPDSRTIKTTGFQSKAHQPPPLISPLPRNADSKFHQWWKRCSQFDAHGNHVMKNRLLRIRISQALPHCIEFSGAEWRMACVCVCVRGGLHLAETCMISRRKLLTFFNYGMVRNVNSLIFNRLWHKCTKKIDNFSTKEQKNIRPSLV